MLFALFLFFTGFQNSLASTQASSHSCDYYQTLESRLQCGPDAYLQQMAYPLCQHYKSKAPWTSEEIQNWFPKVRYCLQAELRKNEKSLTCENLNEVASQTHLDCYIRTGYCDLSILANAQLAALTLPYLRGSWWAQTLELIYQACKDR